MVLLLRLQVLATVLVAVILTAAMAAISTEITQMAEGPLLHGVGPLVQVLAEVGIVNHCTQAFIALVIRFLERPSAQ